MRFSLQSARNRAKMGLYGQSRLKRRFIRLTSRHVRTAALRRVGRGRSAMEQPRLLLIDDEPALADFLANAARECGFEPVITAEDERFPRRISRRTGPTWSRSTSACRAWTASSCCASSPTRIIERPVLIISGFDRRVLEMRLPPWRGARPEHGRAARKAGPARGARGHPQPSSRPRWCHDRTADARPARRLRAGARSTAACTWSISPRSRCATAA